MKGKEDNICAERRHYSTPVDLGYYSLITWYIFIYLFVEIIIIIIIIIKNIGENKVPSWGVGGGCIVWEYNQWQANWK